VGLLSFILHQEVHFRECICGWYHLKGEASCMLPVSNFQCIWLELFHHDKHSSISINCYITGIFLIAYRFCSIRYKFCV
jgi:hypothetical protein